MNFIALICRASQDLLKKDTRRKKDAQLKQQAKAASSKRTKEKNPKDSKTKSSATTDQLVREILSSGNVPEFLPPEILNSGADAPKVHVPEGTNVRRGEIVRTKNKKKANDSPKDVVRGDRVVRVLDKMHTSQSLQPSSKDLREAWLSGRRGRDDSVASHRKPLHKGFLR
jgi:hypothetical protein